MTSLLDILQKEQFLGNIIFQDTDAKTCVIASNTCNILNEILKEDVNKHYIEYSNNMILKTFEELAECKMFAHFKNPNNTKAYKSVQEYDMEIEELSKQIHEHNYYDILEKMKASYNDYAFECNNSRGAESMMFAFMQDEYEKFIVNYLNAEIEEYNEYYSDDDYDY